MRPGVTLHLGVSFGPQQPPPPLQHHHTSSASASAGWKSPVPYLFGGLAAMLGLIAFALLILACSYWKLSGYLESGEVAGDQKLKENNATTESFPNSILVIMAGEKKPTFLAMPAVSKASSLASCSSVDAGGEDGGGGGGGGEEKVPEVENSEEEKSRERTT